MEKAYEDVGSTSKDRKCVFPVLVSVALLQFSSSLKNLLSRDLSESISVSICSSSSRILMHSLASKSTSLKYNVMFVSPSYCFYTYLMEKVGKVSGILVNCRFERDRNKLYKNYNYY